MRVRFWGTRGSVARPVAGMLGYGGNTSCVEVRLDDGTLVVLDCGTGAFGLGQALFESNPMGVRGHLLITHTHWDHIQGFPFFPPLFMPGSEWDIYSSGGLGQRLETTLAGQMDYAYFPVALDQLAATIRYHDLVEGTFNIGGLRVTTKYLNHPALALGYRLQAGNAVLVYAVDHEPHSNLELGEGERRVEWSDAGLTAHAEERRHIAFLHQAGLVIHDAQYTAAEYPRRKGWGHSPMEYAVDMARLGGAKRLALFHHDPMRTDAALDELVLSCRRRAGGAIEVFAAAEGQEIDLDEGGEDRGGASLIQATQTPTVAATGPEKNKVVLIVDDDTSIVHLLVLTLQPEGFRLLTAEDGESALRIARQEHPDLVLSDWQMPRLSGAQLCKALRSEEDPKLRDVPVILITSLSGTEHTKEGFEAGVTDYITKPFTPAIVRSRVRAWLLRS